jgi:hypothetical protein
MPPWLHRPQATCIHYLDGGTQRRRPFSRPVMYPRAIPTVRPATLICNVLLSILKGFLPPPGADLLHSRQSHFTMFQRAGAQRHRTKRHRVGLLLGWLGWGEVSSLGCLWLGEATGREPETVQEMRRDVQTAGLQLVGRCVKPTGLAVENVRRGLRRLACGYDARRRGSSALAPSAFLPSAKMPA